MASVVNKMLQTLALTASLITPTKAPAQTSFSFSYSSGYPGFGFYGGFAGPRWFGIHCPPGFGFGYGRWGYAVGFPAYVAVVPVQTSTAPAEEKRSNGPHPRFRQYWGYIPPTPTTTEETPEVAALKDRISELESEKRRLELGLPPRGDATKPAEPIAPPTPKPKPDVQMRPDTPTPPPTSTSPIRSLEQYEQLMADLVDVHFQYAKADISPQAHEILINNARVLDRIFSQYPDKTFIIEGHADERGSAEYNLGLGELRANSVKNHLETLGANTSKLSVRSYGKERPMCTEQTEACYDLNRRAHFAEPEQ